MATRPSKNPPHGMEGYDIGALSDDQQTTLSNFKVFLRLKKLGNPSPLKLSGAL